jgi:hypothetical protein
MPSQAPKEGQGAQVSAVESVMTMTGVLRNLRDVQRENKNLSAEVKEQAVTIYGLKAQVKLAVDALKVIAEPFPEKPEEGANWPDLWRVLGAASRSALKKLGDAG